MNHLSAKVARRRVLKKRKLCGQRALLLRTLFFNFAALKLLHQRATTPHPSNSLHSSSHPPDSTKRAAATRERASSLMSNGALSSRVSATGVERRLLTRLHLSVLLEHLMLNVTNETVWTRWAHTRRPAALGGPITVNVDFDGMLCAFVASRRLTTPDIIRSRRRSKPWATASRSPPHLIIPQHYSPTEGL